MSATSLGKSLPAEPLAPQGSSTLSSPQGPALVAPPRQLQIFQPQPGDHPGAWISYAGHPAYVRFALAAGMRERLRALAVFAKYFAVILCKRCISYELLPAEVRKPRTFVGALRLTGHILAHMVRNVLPRRRVANRNGVQTALAEQGVCVAPIDPQLLEPIASAAQPLFERLREVRGASSGGRRFEESRSTALRSSQPALFAAIEKMLEASGVLQGVSDYIGHRATLVDVNPQINDASDDFWRRNFPDLEGVECPTPYLHRDASGGDIKIILYMSRVGLNSGPFSYALGTHRARGSRLTDWIEETNDQSGCSGTDPRSRELFAALPRLLQRKCAFGNDLLPESEIAERILHAEWIITAPRGSMVLFDPKGFHRGGMVVDGERLVLTCVLG